MPEGSNGMDSVKCNYTASRLQKMAKARQDPKSHFSGCLMCTTQTRLFLDLVPVEHSEILAINTLTMPQAGQDQSW